MNFTALSRGNDQSVAKDVRAELGRVSSYPQAIDVHVNNGEVTLRGDVLNAEVMNILCRVESISGVRALRYELDGYDSAQGIPSTRDQVADTMGLRSNRWVPAARAAVTAGLVATGAWAMIRARA